MPIQVNARLTDEDWDRVVASMPGVSNAERIAQLVRQQLTLLDAHRSLPDALRLVEALLAPSLQRLREHGLRGAGSEVAETLAKSVAEMSAILLSHAEGLGHAAARAVPELELQLAQRWARASVHVLRTAALEPSSLRHPSGTAAEVRRVFDQAALLQSTPRAAAAPSSGVP